MTPKEYLSQTFYLDHMITNRKKDIEYWDRFAESMFNVKLKDVKNNSRLQDMPFGASISEILKIQETDYQIIADVIKLQREINDRIDSLTDLSERLVLRYRYIQKMSWDNIDHLMHAARSTIFRIHKSALSHFEVPAENS